MAASPNLGRFRMIAPLGAGGMGEVWAAHHRGTGLPVAVKLLTAEAARQPKVRARLQGEARAVAGLRHPAIVTVFDYGVVPSALEAWSRGRLTTGSPFLVMEYVGGGTMHALGAPLPWLSLRAALSALLDALGHSHARGVVHRDIKPGNILVTNSPEADSPLKLADFGVAHRLRGLGPARAASLRAGTAHYMAPEQVLGDARAQGPRTDLYGLGCVAWELATGRPPFHGMSRDAIREAHVRVALPPIEPAVPVPEGFPGWLARLLAKDPQDRFVCAADAAWALEDLGTIATLAVEEEPSRVTLSRAPPTSRGALGPPLPESWRAGRMHPPGRAFVDAGLGLFGLRAPPLTGRERQRDRIWSALREAVSQRKPRVVLLQGPPGMGKSRLASWMCERAEELGGVPSLSVTHIPDDEPLEALREALMGELGLRGLHGEALEQALIAERDRGQPGVEELIALLLPPEAGRDDAMTTEAMPSPFGLAARALAAMARDRGLILRIDDVQWGRDSMALARALLDLRVEAPVLVLLTAREERLPGQGSLLERAEVSAVTLGPLEPEEVDDMLDGLLPLAPALRRRVHEAVGGTPLFIVQLLGDWVRRELLRPGSQGFELAEGEALPRLPVDLRELAAQRLALALEGLPAAAREQLERAAVLGLSVDEHEWRLACDEPDASGELVIFSPQAARIRAAALERLLDSGLAVDTEAGWAFSHGMIRQALLDGAEAAGRLREHHAACARTLSACGARAERLGQHLLRSGQARAALPHLLAGVEERRVRAGPGSALQLVDLIERTLLGLGTGESDMRWGRLWARRALLLNAKGDDATAWRWAEEVRQRGGRHGWDEPVAAALTIQAMVQGRRGRWEDAEARLRDAERLSRTCGDDIGVARARYMLATQLARRGGDPAEIRRLTLQAIATWQAQGVEEDVANAEIFLAMRAVDARDAAGARRLAERARRRFERLRRSEGLALCAHVEAELARISENWPAAIAGYLDALERFERADTPQAEVIRLNLGLIHLRQGQVAEARAYISQAREAMLGLGWASLLTVAESLLLACDAEEARWGRLARRLDRLRRLPPVVDLDAAAASAHAGALAEGAGQRDLADALQDHAARLRGGPA